MGLFSGLRRTISKAIPNEIKALVEPVAKIAVGSAAFMTGGTTGAAAATGNIGSMDDFKNYALVDAAGLAAGAGIAYSGVAAGGTAGAAAGSAIGSGAIPAAAAPLAERIGSRVLNSLFTPGGDVVDAPPMVSPNSIRGASNANMDFVFIIVMVAMMIAGFFIVKRM